AERDHVLGRKPTEGWDDEALARAQRREPVAQEQTKQFEAVSATAELDQVIFDGASFGTPVSAGTPEEEEYLGIPGLLTPDQVAMLLRRREAELQASQKRTPAPRSGTSVAEPPAPDRKSTRLNSSHVKISYDVF